MRFIFLALMMSVLCVYSQAPKTVAADSVFCDCNKAKLVIIRGNGRVGPTLAPDGYGELKEISESKQHSRFVFEREHNSAWYKLVITVDGILALDIIPTNEKDDYDFIIFKSTGKNFCDSFLIKRSKPIRSSISRNKTEIKGLTGLKTNSGKELVKEGPGDAYVKSIEVKKGDIYYLVLDNVYDHGSGHTINFFMEELVTISGQVLNENSKPVKTDVTVTSSSGDTIETTRTDDEGYYKLEAALRRNAKYSLTYYNDQSFFNTKEITTKTPADSLRNIQTVLPSLRKGEKYAIKNINFYGNSYIYLPSSLTSVQSLYKIMKKNKGLKILIVGHTNGCLGTNFSQELSENRAAAIKKFLVEHSIDADRVKTEGRACKEMLYPETGPEWQQSLNRRVEIKVLEL